MNNVIGYNENKDQRKEDWEYLLLTKKNKDKNPRTSKRYLYLLKYFTKGKS
jgi:hypothetical protein